MSAGGIWAHGATLDAPSVIARARDAAGYGSLVARSLIRLLESAYWPQDLLRAACDELNRIPDAGRLRVLEHAPAQTPLPLSESEVWSRLLRLIGAALERDPGQAAGWACFRALSHGRDWLLSAEMVARRDGRAMRQPGGLRLNPSAFNGEQLRAEIVAGKHMPGAPLGDVLRLTWEDSAHLVVQSMPGRFDVVDPEAEPE